ncbi:MAG: asparagine synthase (glutamine-hydrolyzing) [candidate division WOR-3 bacterium]
MCGINGIIDFSEHLDSNNLKQLINVMNKSIIKRGPDDDGVFVDKNVALGMRRLSIIDLQKGKQPIFNENRTLLIIMNGEIYNYKKLKEHLLSIGHKFSTNSDTEVVLHLYEEYGVDSFNKLNGMFAIAIYDLKNSQLVLARDRAGEKPLYYFKDEKYFIFSSEMKGLLASNLIKKEIDKEALNQYLQLTYIPSPNSIFVDVKKLLPGSYLVVNNSVDIKNNIYWDIDFNEPEIKDYEKCKKELKEIFYRVIEETMVSDVPVGTFLSGGIDSSIITGIASKISKKKIDSFTIGYKEKEFDESERAKLSAEKYGVNHHLVYLRVNDFLDEINNIFDYIDEPFADSSLIPTYMISKYASKYVKVVLTGDGGDEIFGGYNKYLIGYYTDKYKKIPLPLRTLLKKAIYSLPDKTYLSHKIRKVIDNADYDLFTQRKNLMCLGFKSGEIVKLLNKNYYHSESLNLIDDYYNKFKNKTNEQNQTFYTDFKIVLEGDMLTKVDRASMMNSLETRVPMLHKDIVEFSIRIPIDYKISGKERKIILKDTFSDLIPKKLLKASKKGFAVPIGKWFRNELKEDLLKELSKKRIDEVGIFNSNYVNDIIKEHLTMKKDRSSELWVLYVFQKWMNNIL